MAQSCHELRVGEPRRGLAANVARPSAPFILVADVSLQMFTHRARAKDEEIGLAGDARRDRLDELRSVLQSMRLTRRLGRTTTAMTHGGVVPNVTRRPTMGRDLGLDPLQHLPITVQPDDDGLACIDPDKGVGTPGCAPCLVQRCSNHDASVTGIERRRIGHRMR